MSLGCWVPEPVAKTPAHLCLGKIYLGDFPFPRNGLAYHDDVIVVEADDEFAVRYSLFKGYEGEYGHPPSRNCCRVQRAMARSLEGLLRSHAAKHYPYNPDRRYHGCRRRHGLPIDEDDLGPADSFERRYLGSLPQLCDDVDDSLAQLFTALYHVKQVFVIIQCEWWKVDLVAFGLEQVPHMMPEWVRAVPAETVRKMTTALEAARRLFTMTSQHVALHSNDASLTAKAISNYIGQLPAVVPAGMYWTPRKGHWEPQRERARQGDRFLGRFGDWQTTQRKRNEESTALWDAMHVGVRDHGTEDTKRVPGFETVIVPLVLHRVKHPRKLKSSVRVSEVPQVSDVVSCKMMTRAGWQLVRGPRRPDEGNWNHQRWTCEQALKPKQVDDEGCHVR